MPRFRRPARKPIELTLKCREPNCQIEFKAWVVSNHPRYCPSCESHRQGKGRNAYMRDYMRTWRAVKRQQTIMAGYEEGEGSREQVRGEGRGQPERPAMGLAGPRGQRTGFEEEG